MYSSHDNQGLSEAIAGIHSEAVAFLSNAPVHALDRRSYYQAHCDTGNAGFYPSVP